jgi:hypothetical protein
VYLFVDEPTMRSSTTVGLTVPAKRVPRKFGTRPTRRLVRTAVIPALKTLGTPPTHVSLPAEAFAAADVGRAPTPPTMPAFGGRLRSAGDGSAAAQTSLLQPVAVEEAGGGRFALSSNVSPGPPV